MNHPAIIEDGYEPNNVRLIDCENTNRYAAAVVSLRPPKPYFWRKHRISIYDTKTLEVLYTYIRNYDELTNLLYVVQNNQEFIITSGAYQCISIYNITKNEFTEYVYPNDEAFEWCEGFCPVDFAWRDNNLIIRGSLFNGPPQVLTIYKPNLEKIKFDNILFEDVEEESHAL